jgi:hypothetical protein
MAEETGLEPARPKPAVFKTIEAMTLKHFVRRSPAGMLAAPGKCYLHGPPTGRFLLPLQTKADV